MHYQKGKMNSMVVILISYYFNFEPNGNGMVKECRTTLRLKNGNIESNIKVVLAKVKWYVYRVKATFVLCVCTIFCEITFA